MQSTDNDGPGTNGLVGAAVALITVALAMAVLGHTTHLGLGSSLRVAIVAGAVLLGACGGALGPRLRRLPQRVHAPRR